MDILDTTNELFDVYYGITAEWKGIKPQLHYTNTQSNIPISPWHDITFKNMDGTINMVCEVPKYTRKKYEINIKLDHNPIIQDTIEIDGVKRLREYKYGDMLFNYGAIPQTWEDPKVLCEKTLKYGDNDPLDILDIGDTMATVGLIYKVKVLGVLALLDDGETDWKVIAINVKDVNSKYIHTLDDINKYKPGCQEAIKRWFEHYKTVRGKRKNCFALNGEFGDKEYTKKVIDACHDMWIKEFT